MIRKLIAVTLPAIALSASIPVFADTVTRYEVRSTTDGVPTIVQPGVVEYRRFSTSSAPNIIETRTITNSVVAPRPVIIPTANTVRLIETPVVAPVAERQIILHNTAPVLEQRVVETSTPVFIRRAPAPVVMETYNPPVVVEKRYVKHHHHSNRHVLDIGAPLVHLRAF